MFQQGEQITRAKLVDIFKEIFKQANSIDHTQIQAITCGQMIGKDAAAPLREYEGYSCCVDQYWDRPYLNEVDYNNRVSFVDRFIKEINLLKGK